MTLKFKCLYQEESSVDNQGMSPDASSTTQQIEQNCQDYFNNPIMLTQQCYPQQKVINLLSARADIRIF